MGRPVGPHKWCCRQDEAPPAAGGGDPGVCFWTKSSGALKCSILGAFEGLGFGSRSPCWV